MRPASERSLDQQGLDPDADLTSDQGLDALDAESMADLPTPTPLPARLRIAFVVDRFGNRYGGAEAYGVSLMSELARDHDITVVAREYDANCPLQLPWVPLPAPGWLPSWLRVLWFAIRARRATRHGFDIVHSHMNGWCGDVEVAHVTPVRYNWRVRPLPWLKRALSRVSLRVQTYLGLEAARVRPRAGHAVVAVSGLIAQQLRQAYGQDRDFPVIPPGVSPADSQAETWRGQIRATLGYGDDDMVCLMVARNPLRKGLPTVVQALRDLPENVRLLVVGCDPATRAWLSQSGHAQALEGRLTLRDPESDVRAYYAAADCCLHPTRNDSFGMVPLEAMAYGLPVVLSPVPWCGFAQYVHDGVDALVLDHPENVQQLTAFVASLQTDAALRDTLSQGARALAQLFGWPEVASRYLALYGALLAQRAGQISGAPGGADAD